MQHHPQVITVWLQFLNNLIQSHNLNQACNWLHNSTWPNDCRINNIITSWKLSFVHLIGCMNSSIPHLLLIHFFAIIIASNSLSSHSLLPFESSASTPRSNQVINTYIWTLCQHEWPQFYLFQIPCFNTILFTIFLISEKNHRLSLSSVLPSLPFLSTLSFSYVLKLMGYPSMHLNTTYHQCHSIQCHYSKTIQLSCTLDCFTWYFSMQVLKNISCTHHCPCLPYQK